MKDVQIIIFTIALEVGAVKINLDLFALEMHRIQKPHELEHK